MKLQDPPSRKITCARKLCRRSASKGYPHLSRDLAAVHGNLFRRGHAWSFVKAVRRASSSGPLGDVHLVAGEAEAVVVFLSEHHFVD